MIAVDRSGNLTLNSLKYYRLNIDLIDLSAAFGKSKVIECDLWICVNIKRGRSFLFLSK